MLGPLKSWDVEKVHAVVARSTFRSQNVQSTSASDYFWKLRCWKSARRCGTKHISKSKCTKHLSVGLLLEVEMSKKCTPLWREAHFEVKMYKTPQRRTTLEVEMSKKCTPLWREAHFEVKSVKTDGFGALLEVEMSKKCTPLWREAHFEVKMLETPGFRTTFGRWDAAPRDRCKWKGRHVVQIFTTLHYTTLHYTTLDYIPPHYPTLHSTTLHYTTQTTTTTITTTTTTILHLHDYATLHYTNYTTLH